MTKYQESQAVIADASQVPFMVKPSTAPGTEALDLSVVKKELKAFNQQEDSDLPSKADHDVVDAAVVTHDDCTPFLSDDRDAVIACQPPTPPSSRKNSGDYFSLPASPRSVFGLVRPNDDFSVDATDTDSVLREERGVQLRFHDSQLWSSFSKLGTEMIINRGGRRMFPHVTVSVQGLDKSAMYNVLLEVSPADDRRFKFINNKWLPISRGDNEAKNIPYLHPDSPNTGKFWEQNRISFAKLKLTNNKVSADGNVLLNSMHQYMTSIIIARQTVDESFTEADKICFPLTETKFTAVTAYQNELITKLKIHNNPFAKAFRVSELARAKDEKKQPCKRSHVISYSDGNGEITAKKLKSLGRKTNVCRKFEYPPMEYTNCDVDLSSHLTDIFIPANYGSVEKSQPVFLNRHMPHAFNYPVMPYHSDELRGYSWPLLSFCHRSILRPTVGGRESLCSSVYCS